MDSLKDLEARNIIRDEAISIDPEDSRSPVEIVSFLQSIGAIGQQESVIVMPVLESSTEVPVDSAA